MKLSYTKRFLKSAAKLPKTEQVKLAALLSKLAESPDHPQLHIKKLQPPLADYYSIRINREYRVLLRIVSPEEIILTKVGHRKDVYR